MSVAAKLAALGPEQKQAGAAACGLIVTLFLPWYEKSAVPAGGQAFVTTTESAFGVVSFVEAAVILVAAGVLFLLWARAEGRPFHLPGGDGTVIMAAGAWAALLLIWRLFDKPDVEGAGAATVGIAWGWFAALVMAGLLATAGARLRAAHRPEPPNPVAEEPDAEWTRPERGERRRGEPADPAAVTEVLRDRPAWDGEPPEAPRPPTGRAAAPGPPTPSGRAPEPPTPSGRAPAPEPPTRSGDPGPTALEPAAGTEGLPAAPEGPGEPDPGSRPRRLF
jgi:hypothetical protein